jgi:hypothetical protein
MEHLVRTILILSSYVRLGLLVLSSLEVVTLNCMNFSLFRRALLFSHLIPLYIIIVKYRLNSACYEAAYILYNCVSVLLLSLDAVFSTLFSNICNCVLSLRSDSKLCTRVTTAVDSIHPSYSRRQDIYTYLVSETSYLERVLVVVLSYFRQFPRYLDHYHVCPHAFNLLFANNPVV